MMFNKKLIGIVVCFSRRGFLSPDAAERIKLPRTRRFQDVIEVQEPKVV
jgi:hypothetical protein